MSANFLVLTYNVGNGRANPVRLVDMLKSSGADIVALQELNELQALEIEKKLQSCFPFRAMFPGGFAGKAILSHFPIINSVQCQLGPERPDLLVTIGIETIMLSVITAHPPPPRLHRTGFYFDPSTLKQIKQLATLANKKSPALLMGDFNLIENQKEYRQLVSSGLRDAFHDSGSGFGFTLPRRVGPWRRMKMLNQFLSWIPLIPVSRVDYIWYTKPLNCLSCWVGKDAGSDHLPVLARMEIPL
jgi:vancomycin resistance protein VanJ